MPLECSVIFLVNLKLYLKFEENMIGKSKVLLSTKIASLHPIGVIIKATSPQVLCSQDLDHLSRLRRSENDQ